MLHAARWRHLVDTRRRGDFVGENEERCRISRISTPLDTGWLDRVRHLPPLHLAPSPEGHRPPHSRLVVMAERSISSSSPGPVSSMVPCSGNSACLLYHHDVFLNITFKLHHRIGHTPQQVSTSINRKNMRTTGNLQNRPPPIPTSLLLEHTGSPPASHQAGCAW